MSGRAAGTEEVQGEELASLETDAGDSANEATDAGQSETKEVQRESVKQTTERILAELSRGQPAEASEEAATKSEGETQAAAEVADEEGQEKQAKPKGKKEDEADELDPDLQPPQRFRARAKELFNNLPKGLKREVNKAVRDLESMIGRERAEEREAITRERQEIRGVHEAVAPFAARWAKMGLTVPQGIMQLAVAQDELLNPKTRFQTYVDLGKDLGINVAPLLATADPNNPAAAAAVNISSDPEIVALKKQNSELLGWKRSIESSNFETVVNSITAELSTVKHEKDPASGRYLYPELHEEAFLDRVKPLVSALIGITPDLSYADAVKRAILTTRGNVSGAPGQFSRTSSPAAQANNHRPAHVTASVRGLSAPSIQGSVNAPPPEALRTVKATTQWVEEQLRQGRQV